MSPSRIPLLALAADLVAVVVFAAAGQLAHGGSGERVGLLATIGLFGAGLVVGWAVPLVRISPVTLRAGAIVLAATAVVGLLLRTAVTGRLPLSFGVVAVLSLAVLLLGWRLMSAAVARRVARLH